jgi:cytochrome c oxidase accessory protein FixG
MEMVFRKIEYLIEGDAGAQRALDAAPWTRPKIFKKGLKHAVFFGLSFLIANWLLSYIIGIESLLQIVVDDPREHVTGLTFMVLFTTVFYLIFARFREQACTFICPYGRFQSAMLDENTMVVAYDYKRGEKRAPLHRNQAPANRLAEGYGDCVSCNLCVAVCPTGIDIRNGTQMECVHCTACIDACDGVMDKVKRPRGLIRYASLNSIEKGQPFRFTARMASYAVVVTVLAAALGVLVFTRSAVETTLLRAPGALYQQAADGRISNLYTLKVLNKSGQPLPIEFRLENTPGVLRLMGAANLVVPRQDMAQASMLIELDPADTTGPKTKLKIGVYSSGRRLEVVNTVFAGPRP